MALPTTTTAENLHDRPTVAPRVDIVETSTGVRLIADMPGVSPDSLDVDIEPGQLRLTGRRSRTIPEGAVELLGGRLADYERTFALSDDVDLEHVTASMSDGVLTLELPKHARSQPRRISVQRA